MEKSTYEGTGYPEITKEEWIENQHRDSYCSYIGHHSLLSYMSVTTNQSIGRLKYEFIERMYGPCELSSKTKEIK